MKSCLVFLMVLVSFQLGLTGEGHCNNLFASFADVVLRGEFENWKVTDPTLSNFDCVLLEYACGTGEMRNHQPLRAHTDSNKSHPVESLMLFGKLPETVATKRCHCTSLVESMKDGMLIQPYERLVWQLRCGHDVLHCRFSNTYHLADVSRGALNWSYVHGP